MAFPITPYRLRKHSAHTSWGPLLPTRKWPVALACRLTLFEPSKQKLKNAQSPWPPRLTRRRVAPAFQPKRAGLKLALATYQPSLRISQDDSIFPSLANLKGTGIIRPRISSLRRRCSNPEDRYSSFLLFRKIADLGGEQIADNALRLMLALDGGRH